MSTTPKPTATSMRDDDLLEELVFWLRVGRNENGLKGDDKKRLSEITAEVTKRDLLKKK